MPKEDDHTRSGELHTFILLFLCLMVFSSAAVYVLNNKGLPVFRYPAKSTPTPLPTVPTKLSQQARCNEEDVTFKVKPSTDQGFCELSMTLTGYTVSGYTLRYPETWTVNTAGAEAMNVYFNKGSDTEVFIQLTSSNLALEQADKATYSFESSEEIPLVDPDETEISRKIEEVGGIKTLRLLTSLDDTTVVRYFLTHAQGDKTSIYMFKTTGESDAMEESVRKMVASFKTQQPVTAAEGRKLYKDAMLAYTFEYPDDSEVSVCQDIPCASISKYTMRIEGVETFEKSQLMKADLFCNTNGPTGSTECKNTSIELYVNSQGVTGYKILRRKTVTKVTESGNTVGKMDDVAYVFPTTSKEYPGLLLAVDESTLAHLAILETIADSYSDNKK